MKKRDRSVWLNRGWQPVDIIFCPTKKAWDQEIKRLNGNQPWPEAANKGGHCLLGENDVTGVSAILVAVYSGAERDANEVIMTLVHEAVHVWQFCCRVMGESAPGIEIEAYAIEEISRGLVDAYCQTRGKGKVWAV
jgi:hypothetical protein